MVLYIPAKKSWANRWTNMLLINDVTSTYQQIVVASSIEDEMQSKDENRMKYTPFDRNIAQIELIRP